MMKALMLMGFTLPVYLAHGALGYWDEVIFISIIVIFLVMMGVSWFRSRSMTFTEEDLSQSSSPDKSTQNQPTTANHFELD